jgi:hypothetical protein
MMGNTEDERQVGPEDAALLAAVGRIWQQVDPPPVDLADGVLARIAAEDLEFDLLTLVESEDALAGVRSATHVDDAADQDEAGSWSLEYAGPDLRVYIRLTRLDRRTRLDGWVVPARPLTVRLRADDGAAVGEATLETAVDEFGRFELPDAPSGLARLTFFDEPRTATRPRITPPFWI